MTRIKALFIVSLLLAIVCLEKGHSLWCYRCEDESSNLKCLKMAKCPEAEKFCVTTIVAAGRGVFGWSDEQQITKGCSSNCTEHKVDTGIASVSTKCCTSSLCNMGGQ